MKHLIIIAFLSFTSCKSNKELKKEDLPFKVEHASFQNWYGGMRGSEGIYITVLGTNPTKECEYTTMYYLDKKAKIHTQLNENEIQLKGNINRSTNLDKNLSNNPNEEYGNKAPEKLKYSNLNKNELIIEYLLNGKEKSLKINLIEKAAIYMP